MVSTSSPLSSPVSPQPKCSNPYCTSEASPSHKIPGHGPACQLCFRHWRSEDTQGQWRSARTCANKQARNTSIRDRKGRCANSNCEKQLFEDPATKRKNVDGKLYCDNCAVWKEKHHEDRPLHACLRTNAPPIEICQNSNCGDHIPVVGMRKMRELGMWVGAVPGLSPDKTKRKCGPCAKWCKKTENGWEKDRPKHMVDAGRLQPAYKQRQKVIEYMHLEEAGLIEIDKIEEGEFKITHKARDSGTTGDVESKVEFFSVSTSRRKSKKAKSVQNEDHENGDDSDGSDPDDTPLAKKRKQPDEQTTSNKLAKTKHSTPSTPSKAPTRDPGPKASTTDLAAPSTVTQSIVGPAAVIDLNMNNEPAQLFSDEDLFACVDKVSVPLEQAIRQEFEERVQELEEQVQDSQAGKRELQEKLRIAEEKLEVAEENRRIADQEHEKVVRNLHAGYRQQGRELLSRFPGVLEKRRLG